MPRLWCSNARGVMAGTRRNYTLTHMVPKRAKCISIAPLSRRCFTLKARVVPEANGFVSWQEGSANARAICSSSSGNHCNGCGESLSVSFSSACGCLRRPLLRCLGRLFRVHRRLLPVRGLRASCSSRCGKAKLFSNGD